MGESHWSFSGKALIVDDEDRVRRTVGRMLIRRGLQIVAAKDGAEAVEFFQESPELFALVLLDLSMPRMDGRETIHELRRIDSAVRIILISGHSEQEVEERLGGVRPSGFIQKPFDVDTFDAEVTRVLG